MDWWKTLGDAFGRRNTPPRSGMGSSGGRAGPNSPQDEPEAIDSPLVWGPEQWDEYLNASTPPTPIEFPEERGGIRDSLAAAGAELRSWPGQALEARSRVQSSEPVVAFNQAMEGIFGAIGQGLRSGAQAVGQEVFMPLIERLAETPKGREVIEALANPESQQQFVSFMERTAEALESFGESSMMYELDNPSALAAEALIASGLAPAPERGSGAAGRPLMMDVAGAEGLPAPLALLSEMFVVEHYPSMPPGVGAALGALTQAAGVFSRQFSGVLRRAAGSADELAETMNRVLPSAVGEVAGEVANAARLAREAAIPEPMRQMATFMNKLDEVETRYADNPAAVRQWAYDAPAPLDIIDRVDGVPVLKSAEHPNGLTAGELAAYHQARKEAIAAHGSYEALETAVLDAYRRGSATTGDSAPMDWYPQQQILNDIQDAVGDDVVGRALFEHLNDLHARASSRSKPRNQALRAVFVWAHEMLGVHPGSMLNMPVGAGANVHREQVLAMGQGVLNPRIIDLIRQPKNFTYSGSLSGNLNDVVADVHWYRTIMNDLRSGVDDAVRMPFEDAGIGKYLAIRDFGIEIGRKHNIKPGTLQGRVWGGNAELTGVGGTSKDPVEPFDRTAAGAFDAVMGYLARSAGLDPNASSVDVMKMLMRGDPSLAAVLRDTPYERMANISEGDALADLVSNLDVNQARSVILEGAEAGRIGGLADAMRVYSEPDVYRRAKDTPAQRARLITPVFRAMAEKGFLAQDQVDAFLRFLASAKQGGTRIEIGRLETTWMNIDSRLGNLLQGLSSGRRTFFDTVANRMAQAGEGAKGFAVSPYNELQRAYPASVLDSEDDLAEALAHFLLTRGEFLAEPAHGIGGQAYSGSLYLDVVVMPFAKSRSVSFGELGKQKGMYDFSASPENAYTPFTERVRKPDGSYMRNPDKSYVTQTPAWATGGVDADLIRPAGISDLEWDAELVRRARVKLERNIKPYFKKNQSVNYPHEMGYVEPGPGGMRR
jgi:hypothetical protein